MSLIASNVNLPWQPVRTQKPIILQFNFNKISLLVVSLNKSCKVAFQISSGHMHSHLMDNDQKHDVIPLRHWNTCDGFNGLLCLNKAVIFFPMRHSTEYVVFTQTKISITRLIKITFFLKSGVSKKVSKKICFPLFVNSKTVRMLTKNNH